VLEAPPLVGEEVGWVSGGEGERLGDECACRGSDFALANFFFFLGIIDLEGGRKEGEARSYLGIEVLRRL
jgi:hypothetical protein